MLLDEKVKLALLLYKLLLCSTELTPGLGLCITICGIEVTVEFHFNQLIAVIV